MAWGLWAGGGRPGARLLRKCELPLAMPVLSSVVSCILTPCFVLLFAFGSSVPVTVLPSLFVMAAVVL